MNFLKSKMVAMLAGAALALSLTPVAAQKVKITRTETRTVEDSTPEAFPDTQRKLLGFLRETPAVAGAVARDPSLLGEKAYMERSNPQLAEFLAAHPEVGRNPEYYLFTDLPRANGDREHALQRELWPEYLHNGLDIMDIVGPIAGVVALAVFLGSIVWIVRLFSDGRRQSRQLKTQSELQSRLVDKLGTSEELLAYLNSEAGQKMLVGNADEAALPAPNFTMERVARPLQIGVGLIVLSLGVFLLKSCGFPGQSNAVAASTTHAVSILLGAVGCGFILSAAIAWMMAKKMGLLPAPARSEVTSDRL